VLVCVSPNPSIDKLFVAEAVVPGAIHRPRRLVARAGGKGLNVARAAHALGADVRAVALLAGHAGRWVAEALAGDGVACDLVWGDGETRTSLSVAAQGAMTEFYERGDAPGAAAWTAFADAVAAAAAARGGAAWVSVSGSMPPGVDPGQAAKLVRRARAAGALVAVDQHGPTLEHALAAGPDLVKVNRHEAAEATGAGDPAQAAAVLRERQIAAGAAGPAAIVTLGEEGAIGVLPDGRRVRATLGAHGPYPTGSGDSFLAGLLTARHDGAPWDAALAAALGAAAANAEAEGASTLDAARARELAARARGGAAPPRTAPTGRTRAGRAARRRRASRAGRARRGRGGPSCPGRARAPCARRCRSRGSSCPRRRPGCPSGTRSPPTRGRGRS
jgi:1-phosphofructokinase family hexose kinase